MTEKHKQPPIPAKSSLRRFFKCFLNVPVFEAGALLRERDMTGESVILSGSRTVKKRRVVRTKIPIQLRITNLKLMSNFL